ncbi:hypothetical protein [Mucilaginibacter polytrichastri]|uniref:Uncharacterized protein n=1 Tax=Mucilaginibacter polytrichastri TaxID=1302689 RepID=A0A1Q6A2G2_9SPHI|nr:hypothetical protein [Mucilaginibacter polytrichastri]OKS88200.1 hypothetical protein RG47T_3664 [Mucilaginibacter polytrichastri]SFT08446.1 hypothetical protein SAMN04487890_11032 [Mucilaginibacter polytrichastri]
MCVFDDFLDGKDFLDLNDQKTIEKDLAAFIDKYGSETATGYLQAVSDITYKIFHILYTYDATDTINLISNSDGKTRKELIKLAVKNQRLLEVCKTSISPKKSKNNNQPD